MAGIAYALNHGLAIQDVKTFIAAGNWAMVNEGAVAVTKTVGAATQITLTPSPSTGMFRWVIDGLGDAATNNITVIGAASETINGASSYVISENYGAACFFYNGTEWNIVTTYKANAATGAVSGTTGTFTTMNATTANVTGTGTIGTINATTLNVAGITTDSDVSALAAAGTVIANAAALTHAITVVSAADDAKGVVLPTAVAGKRMEVWSSQATNGLKIYPPINGTINGGSANTAIVIEGLSLARFVGTNATNWASAYTVNA